MTMPPKSATVRHASQDRFDRVARGELQRPAYTEAQISNWTETDFNWHMRQTIHSQGFNVIHIREASETGVADLVVYKTGVLLTDNPAFDHADGKKPLQTVEAWIELKSENNKPRYLADPRKASQRQFMREHWDLGRNAIYVMMDREVGMLAVHQGDLKGVVKMLPMSPYSVDWSAVFAHFKARR